MAFIGVRMSCDILFKNANKREINFKSFTNQWRRATIFIVERKDNIPIGFIFTIMELDDQTANKIEYDAKIADQNAILEKQQILLEQSLANAEAANNAKTAFLNNMSHHLNNMHPCLQVLLRLNKHWNEKCLLPWKFHSR